MLADAATIAENKLYIHGGQWDVLGTPGLPLRHPALAVALVLEIPYDEAMKMHTLEVSLELDGIELDAPRVAGNLQTGHPAIGAPGAPSFTPIAIPFQNLELHDAGRYDWLIKIDGEIIGRIPMTVFVLPQPPVMGGQSG